MEANIDVHLFPMNRFESSLFDTKTSYRFLLPPSRYQSATNCRAQKIEQSRHKENALRDCARRSDARLAKTAPFM